MDTNQLYNILSKNRIIKRYFLGVFAANEIPCNIYSVPCIFIANTDVSSELGTHWVCIYIDSNMQGYFFDSFGRSPCYYKHYHFSNFLDNNSNSWIYNTIQLQSLQSSVCGQYCIAFAYYICRGQSITKFLSYFTRNKLLNDIHIDSFVNERICIYR